MKNLKPIEIADKLIELSGINVFEQSRVRDVIEMRGLLCYLLREKRLMRWTAISTFFQENGKPMDHATVIHAIKNYPLYYKSNKKIQEFEKMFTFSKDLSIDEVNKIQYLENKCNRCEEKLKELNIDTSLYNTIKRIPPHQESYIKEKIDLLLKEYEWKSKLKDTSTVYAGV
tara:strand:+ start:104 stop:619 length:516 start_codon:yes stop_codon:yes gene_type:complete